MQWLTRHYSATALDHHVDLEAQLVVTVAITTTTIAHLDLAHVHVIASVTTIVDLAADRGLVPLSTVVEVQDIHNHILQVVVELLLSATTKIAQSQKSR